MGGGPMDNINTINNNDSNVINNNDLDTVDNLIIFDPIQIKEDMKNNENTNITSTNPFDNLLEENELIVDNNNDNKIESLSLLDISTNYITSCQEGLNTIISKYNPFNNVLDGEIEKNYDNTIIDSVKNQSIKVNNIINESKDESNNIIIDNSKVGIFNIKSNDSELKPTAVEDLYSCPICLDIFCSLPPREVVKCNACENLFCRNCLHDSLKATKGSCPLCREDPYPIVRHEIAEKAVGEIPAECAYHINGCSIKLPRKDLDEHEKNCKYKENKTKLKSLRYSSSNSTNINTRNTMSSFFNTPLLRQFGGINISNDSLNTLNDDNTQNEDSWECKICTFMNHPALAHCEMCENDRIYDHNTENENDRNTVICPTCTSRTTITNNNLYDGLSTTCNVCNSYFVIAGKKTIDQISRGSATNNDDNNTITTSLRTLNRGRQAYNLRLNTTHSLSNSILPILSGELYLKVKSKKLFFKWKPMRYIVVDNLIQLYSWKTDSEYKRIRLHRFMHVRTPKSDNIKVVSKEFSEKRKLKWEYLTYATIIENPLSVITSTTLIRPRTFQPNLKFKTVVEFGSNNHTNFKRLLEFIHGYINVTV